MRPSPLLPLRLEGEAWQWLEIPPQVSEFSRGNGTYCFELITSSSDSGFYSSKQSTSPPQLVVTQGP